MNNTKVQQSAKKSNRKYCNEYCLNMIDRVFEVYPPKKWKQQM